jgi:cytochrome c oxidase cbb3-type subunit 4
MDINDLRSITTVAMLMVFAGIVWWAYSARHKQAFDEAANLPLLDDEAPAVSSDSVSAGRRNN